MDPTGLLISIASLAIAIDALHESYGAASGTLDLIRSQISILESGTQRINEWLQFTDHHSKAQITNSLRDSVSTVDNALNRLRDDIQSITHTSPATRRLLGRTGSDQWVKAKYVLNESVLKSHLTDVRECASLLHFTLNVCQLPLGPSTQLQINDLQVGARTLQRAQSGARIQRRMLLLESSASASQKHSPDFEAFMKSVMAAEAELPESPMTTRLALVASDDSGSLEMPTGLREGLPATKFIDDLGEPISPDTTVVQSSSVPRNKGKAVATVHRGDLDTLPSRSRLAQASASASSSHATSSAPPKPPQVAVQETSTSVPARKPILRKRVGSGPRVPSASAKGEPVSSPPTPEASPLPAAVDKFECAPEVVHDPLQEKMALVGEDSAVIAREERQAVSHGITNRESTMMVRRASSASSTNSLEGLSEEPPPSYSALSPASPASTTSSLITDEKLRRADMAESTSGSASFSTLPRMLQLVQENNLAQLRVHVQSSDVNEKDPQSGRTAIMEAALLGRTEVARILTQAGCHLHLQDIQGNTALHHCADQGYEDICHLLMRNAYRPDRNLAGKTALDLAAANGHVEVVLRLLNSIPNRKADDPAMVNAFFEAVKSGDVNTAQVFVAKDLKPKKIKESWKPVCFAAQSGSLPMLEFVLSQKCPLKGRSPTGWTPLHFAARHGHQTMVEHLLSLKVPWKAQTRKTEETALHFACLYNEQRIAASLIAHKDASVSMQDADGHAPLHHAIRNGNLALVNLLRDKGANFKDGTRYGWKPIHLATAYGHLTLVADMMTHGISIEEKLASPAFKPEKRTSDAARRGYNAEIRWPHQGARALHLALEFGHEDIARMLIDGGVKLEEEDSLDWRPLHYAAFNCRPTMVQILLDKGVSPSAKTDDGHTALTLGTRTQGLDVTAADREKVEELLTVAMAGRKKSLLNKMSESISLAPKSNKVATKRNTIWHKAAIAEALYKMHSDGQSEDGETLTEVESESASEQFADERTPSIPKGPGPTRTPTS